MKNLLLPFILSTLLAVLLYLSSSSPDSAHLQSAKAQELPFQKNINFTKFMGVWYNIASIPNIIDGKCRCSQSVDTLESPLNITLSESCLILGKNVTSKSKAIASVDGYGNWTNWNGPISAPYWVVKMDPEYGWAIIGQPSRKGFWVISRNTTMDKILLETLFNWGTAQGFDIAKVQLEDQSCWGNLQQL